MSVLVVLYPTFANISQHLPTFFIEGELKLHTKVPTKLSILG